MRGWFDGNVQINVTCGLTGPGVVKSVGAGTGTTIGGTAAIPTVGVNPPGGRSECRGGGNAGIATRRPLAATTITTAQS